MRSSDTIQYDPYFLCDRKQSVCVSGNFSTWHEVLSGIPQGNILGPLLFLIYINDLPDQCSKQDASTKTYLYADDAYSVCLVLILSFIIIGVFLVPSGHIV